MNVAAASQDILARVQNAHAELEKRYALCIENNCKTIMEYNQKADNKLPQSLVIVPLLCEWDNEALKLLRNIANKGRAADIHIAVGSADGKLPSALEMCCQEKITAPAGADPLLKWYCPGYSVTVFQ